MLPKTHRASFVVLAFFSLAAIAGQNAASAAELKSKYFGRWVVDDPTEEFSTNGKLYRMIEIVQCGSDMCGKSVTKDGCGATLFRYFGTRVDEDLLTGHGAWGSGKKKLMIEYVKNESVPDQLSLGLGGEDYDLTAREGSMATFEAQYHRVNDALSCEASTS